MKKNNNPTINFAGLLTAKHFAHDGTIYASTHLTRHGKFCKEMYQVMSNKGKIGEGLFFVSAVHPAFSGTLADKK
jgi:hypothetical protein